MDIELLRRELQELQEIINGWDNGDEVADIERDIAVDKVKRVYETLRFLGSTTPPQSAPEDREESHPEIEVELTYQEEEQETEVQEEQEYEQEEPLFSLDLEDITILPEQEQQESEVHEEQQEVGKVENALFDLDTIPIRQTSRRSAILSLYSDETQREAKPKAKPHVEPKAELQVEKVVEEPKRTLIIADTLTPEVETLAESYTSSSINDRYIIAQNLFGGDILAYETMMEQLGRIDNFDDCMIYIVENYNWSGDDEATKLVIKLLEERFSIK